MPIQAIMRDAFVDVMKKFNDSPAVTLLRSGALSLAHYKAVLREIYHYAKEDPQIQALATVYLRGNDREAVKMFLRHAASEVGHDQMALRDLANLGEDVAHIPDSNPLPTTIAFTAFPFYLINYRNPIGYLGYLYFLEFMPTQAGDGYRSALSHAGVPESSMTFLAEHISVDVGHNRLMGEYLDRLVRSQADADAVVYAMRVTGELYAKMLWGAMESAGNVSAADFGRDPVEAGRRSASGVW